MAIKHGTRLVERGTTPEIGQNQNLILVVERRNALFDLGTDIVGTHAWHQRHGADVGLVTEHHAARLLDTGCELAMASDNNSYQLSNLLLSDSNPFLRILSVQRLGIPLRTPRHIIVAV